MGFRSSLVVYDLIETLMKLKLATIDDLDKLIAHMDELERTYS